MAAKKAKAPVDLLGTLVKSATVKTAEAPKKENVQTASPELARLVNEYTASAVIAKIAEEQKKADEVDLKAQAFDAFVSDWAAKGQKPENPVLKAQHASVRLQVKGPFKVMLPPDAELSLAAVQDALPEQVAAELADCIKVEQNLTVKALDKLLDEGTDDEKAAAKAAMVALSGLSDKHKALLLETKPRFAVDADRLSALLASACDGDADVMRAVLGILTPQLALSQPKNEKALEIAAARFAKAQAQEAAPAPVKEAA